VPAAAGPGADDLRMPELDGIETTRQLSELLPSAAVIVLSAYDDPARAVGPASWSR
jgi:DNA-binding NarL/FixJ family response regulator